MTDDCERLSRFIDLSDPGTEGFPKDIERFRPDARPAIPDVVCYPGPDGDVAVQCFDIGLVLAGAFQRAPIRPACWTI